MARGWESKAVADQMERLDARNAKRETPYDTSPAVRERQARLRTLELSRARTLDQLNRATNARHREMLERTLRALEREIEELN
jgi:hypothetical protein